MYYRKFKQNMFISNSHLNGEGKKLMQSISTNLRMRYSYYILIVGTKNISNSTLRVLNYNFEFVFDRIKYS